MVGVMAGTGRSPRLRGAIISAAPMLLLGFTMFVVALNLRHYSSAGDAQGAREAALNRAAMERRINALEKEILQNSVFLEKVLRGLDDAFQASAVLSVKELRELAQVEASEIGQRRARQPPPPMSDFARSRVAKAVDGGKLNDLVLAAVGSESSSFSSGGAGGDSGTGIANGRHRDVNGGNGWDWGPTSTESSDDFLMKKEVDLIEPVKLDISDEERRSSCRKWLKDYGVTPQVDWGTLPAEQQKLWTQYRCDDVPPAEPPSADPDPQAEEKLSRPLAPEGKGDGSDGAGQAAAAAAALDDGGSGREPRGGQDGGRGDAAADAADGELDGDSSVNAEAAAAGAVAAARAEAGVAR